IIKDKDSKGSINCQKKSIDDIYKYKELLDMGAITQEEFDQKKKELLDL
ncbi:MAG: SHOCT domain-containing protein, partial [Eubacterium sp.]|nr:SHOCT domain-containing protein [Eubacterium sp.]